MIVKIAIQKLKQGMVTVNPGLSPESNPHLWLADSEIGTGDQVRRMLESGFLETFIDTEKGEYFRVHRYEKTLFEKPFTEVSTGPAGGAAGFSFDSIANRAEEAEKCYRKLLEYSRSFARRFSDTRKIDIGDSGILVETILEGTAELGDALLFLAKLQHYDDYSFTHNLNVAIIAVLFGRYLGLGEENLRVVGLSGLFHDIGKVLIPNRILKKPGRLTPGERAEVRRHPAHSRAMLLAQKGVPEEVVRAAWEHHEYYGGGGYPRGLSHGQIGKASSLLSIVDTFDALTTDRCYRSAVHAHKAMSIIFNLRGSSFSPVLVDRFVKYVGVYPVGSIVMLNNGKKAIVVEQNQDNLLAPKVRLVLDEDNRYYPPQDLDLQEEATSASPLGILECLDPSECRIRIQDFLPNRGSGIGSGAGSENG